MVLAIYRPVLATVPSMELTIYWPELSTPDPSMKLAIYCPVLLTFTSMELDIYWQVLSTLPSMELAIYWSVLSTVPNMELDGCIALLGFPLTILLTFYHLTQKPYIQISPNLPHFKISS